jgi:hypothetical protein
VWGQGTGGRASPLNQSAQATELPNAAIVPTPNRRESSDNYYEDVDPRFADPLPSQPPLGPPRMLPANQGTGYTNSSNGNLRVQPPQSQPLGGADGNSSYEDIQSGQRSPAESERSNFTSVSQRGINPRWNPGPNYGGSGPMPNRRPAPQQAREDMLLNSNPDFMLPGGGGRGRGGARGGPRGRGGPQATGRIPGQIPGMVPNSAYPQ